MDGLAVEEVEGEGNWVGIDGGKFEDGCDLVEDIMLYNFMYILL